MLSPKVRRWLKRTFKWLASASSLLISILLTVNQLLPLIEFLIRYGAWS